MKERPKLDKLINISLKVMGVSYDELIGYGRSFRINMCRGIYLMLAYEYGHRTDEAAKAIHRSRTSCLITANRYLGYYSVGDKIVTKYFNECLSLLKNDK